MNTEIVSMTKNATIRIDACMADDLSRTYGSVSNGVEEIYEVLKQVRLTSLNEVRGLFSPDEWKAIADSLNGTMADGMFRTNVGAFIAHLEDSERYEHTLTKWGVKLEDLTAKIKTLKGSNIEALYTRVEDFWKDPKDLEEFSKW